MVVAAAVSAFALTVAAVVAAVIVAPLVADIGFATAGVDTGLCDRTQGPKMTNL